MRWSPRSSDGIKIKFDRRCHPDLLKTFGLSRNPFTDRTAEKTCIDPLSLYVHSDLRGLVCIVLLALRGLHHAHAVHHNTP